MQLNNLISSPVNSLEFTNHYWGIVVPPSSPEGDDQIDEPISGSEIYRIAKTHFRIIIS